jgi:hypothetical protein
MCQGATIKAIAVAIIMQKGEFIISVCCKKKLFESHLVSSM